MKTTIQKSLQASSKILMDNFGSIEKVEVKQDQSNIVTQADLDSEKAIVKIVEKDFPDHNIIAEETGFQSKGSQYTWIIDPLDGTSNFSTGLSWFGVLISVLKDWEPVASGAALPFYNYFYLAEKGKGSFLNDKKISVSDETELRNILAVYSLDFKENFSITQKESQIIAKLVRNTRNLRSTNSLVDQLYVAEGKFGSCINQTTKIWDIAAPSLIIEEAGGIVTDINGDKLNFKVSETDYERNYTIVASTKILHPKLMRLIKG